jgi:hypothetical protein
MVPYHRLVFLFFPCRTGYVAYRFFTAHVTCVDSAGCKITVDLDLGSLALRLMCSGSVLRNYSDIGMKVHNRSTRPH